MLLGGQRKADISTSVVSTSRPDFVSPDQHRLGGVTTYVRLVLAVRQRWSERSQCDRVIAILAAGPHPMVAGGEIEIGEARRSLSELTSASRVGPVAASEIELTDTSAGDLDIPELRIAGRREPIDVVSFHRSGRTSARLGQAGREPSVSFGSLSKLLAGGVVTSRRRMYWLAGSGSPETRIRYSPRGRRIFASAAPPGLLALEVGCGIEGCDAELSVDASTARSAGNRTASRPVCRRWSDGTGRHHLSRRAVPGSRVGQVDRVGDVRHVVRLPIGRGRVRRRRSGCRGKACQLALRPIAVRSGRKCEIVEIDPVAS